MPRVPPERRAPLLLAAGASAALIVAVAALVVDRFVGSPSTEADRLFATPDQCELSLQGYRVGIMFPGEWSTNDALEAANVPACVWFGPGPLEIATPLALPPEGVAVTVGSAGGPAFPRHPWISREETTVAGRPALRVETSIPPSDGEARTTLELVYWVALGGDLAAGPTLVASTSDADVGDYSLNSAVLDRMMAKLVIRVALSIPPPSPRTISH